jgi:predicted O-methyltransferase YrrM
MTVPHRNISWLLGLTAGLEPVAIAQPQEVLGDWSVAHGLAQVLERLAASGGFTSILEFGAGRSSEAFVAGLQACGNGGRLTSVDHAPEYSREAWQRVLASGVDATLLVAPIERRLSANGFYYSYPAAADGLARRAPYDLVFIDAPPSEFGRDGPLHQAAPHLAPGTLVILDDAGREAEQRTLRRWLRIYPNAKLLIFEPGFARGLAVIEVSGGSSTQMSWSSFFESFLDSQRSTA